MYDVEDFKLMSKGWHIVRIKSATIKPTDRTKNPDTENDKNFVVEMEVKEGSSDDGCTTTKYFAHIARNDFTLKQLGALLVCSGTVKAEQIKGKDFFDSPAFETNFQMKLPEKLVGVWIEHRAGDKLNDRGEKVYFPDIRKFRVVKDALAEMKKNGGVRDEQKAEATASGTQAANPVSPTTSAPSSDSWD